MHPVRGRGGEASLAPFRIMGDGGGGAAPLLGGSLALGGGLLLNKEVVAEAVGEVQGLGQALVFSYAKNCVSVAAQGLTRWWGLRAHWGPQEADGKAVGEEPETGHWVLF